jgi:frataxin-like iron-binding protein CyaY
MRRLLIAPGRGATLRWGGSRASVRRECEFGKRWLSNLLSLNEFHDVADHTLESLMDKLGPVEDSIEDVDISYAVPMRFCLILTTLQQGVLTVDLGKNGIWVINKQTPNRQIWWSSPIR